MKDVAVALSVWAALSGVLASTPALAAGRIPPPRDFQAPPAVHAPVGGHARASFRTHRGFDGRHRAAGRHLGRRAAHHGRSFPGHVPGKLRPDLVPPFAAPVVLFAPPVVYAPPPVVSVTQIVYSPPAVSPSPLVGASAEPPRLAATPPVAPLPSVVEYPTGRYELRGDGLSTPYAWVWVPHPPAGPPAAPPAGPDEPRAGSAAASPRTIYRWTDEEGTTFWTNRLDRVPERHRPLARSPGAPDDELSRNRRDVTAIPAREPPPPGG